MFQTYDDVADPSVGPARLARLRAEIARLGLTGFLVPLADEHQGEYLPPSAERLKWLTGFTGSAGFVVALKERAAIFVDGRYTLQVRDQVDCAVFEPVHLVDTPPAKWLETALVAGDRIGYDPWLHTIAGVKRLKAACAKAGAELVAVDRNLVDLVWDDRPAPPTAKIEPHPLALAGRASTDKLAAAAEAIAAKGADAAVLVQGDGIAWTFNVRGRDVAHTPLVLAFALLKREGRAELFIAEAKLDATTRAALAEVADLHPVGALAERLAASAAGGGRLLLDPALTAEAIGATVTAAGGVIVEGDDPTLAMKAVKNEAELSGTRAAHLRDGVALARFLAWFDRAAAAGGLDEITVAERLEAFRRETGELRDVSFATISGAGPNGAIVHYRVTRATNRTVEPDSLFLIDSGGQYRDGTTDVTRTLVVGRPTAEMRDRFTRVLKGMIAVATARFPVGTTGAQLDTLARLSLWKAGLDYDHGTGHGVGSYLGVHEGPQRISRLGTVALEPGMILSDEPGYYKTGAYGIRLENLVVVTPPAPIEGGEREMLGFETLTLAPFDRRGIEPSLLTADEIAWLNAYHARVAAEIAPRLDAETRAWLTAATAPL